MTGQKLQAVDYLLSGIRNIKTYNYFQESFIAKSCLGRQKSKSRRVCKPKFVFNFSLCAVFVTPNIYLISLSTANVTDFRKFFFVILSF